ncbi:DUF3224 domain-containing protein [Nakamurella deserti]|uniref:DUF3224 domain-containing protein n=1 Tax=Nakamurella deserti TaxID=2164074 RepID=UPI000DBE3CFA|nr:DUF3224 domain-containing protein [Nakamurella deserti]
MTTASAEGTFTVSQFVPTDHVPGIVTALGVGHAHMVKTFTGAVEGRSETQFSYAFSEETGTGTYVALESFEGSVDGRRGTLNLAHSATTDGVTRSNEFFLIVPGSGTGELAGMTGGGALVIDGDTERFRLDYTVG